MPDQGAVYVHSRINFCTIVVFTNTNLHMHKHQIGINQLCVGVFNFKSCKYLCECHKKSDVFSHLYFTPWLLFPDGEDIDETTGSSGGQMAAQLNNIRLKLEEKRRRIEQEKRRMEVAVNRQRQQLGQQAFLQAVTRVSLTWTITGL